MKLPSAADLQPQEDAQHTIGVCCAKVCNCARNSLAIAGIRDVIPGELEQQMF